MNYSLLEEFFDGSRTPPAMDLRAERHFYTVSGRRSRQTMNEPPSSKTVAQPADKKILIVDDDDDLRELLALILKQEGFTTSEAPDGKEALAAVKDQRPDLIILDLMLPRYGGYEVLRELQKGETSSIPIFVVTGRYKDLATANMIRNESNVVEFLEKPIDQESLTGKAHSVLGTTSQKT